MNEKRLNRLLGGIDKWKDNFGQGMEYRGNDGMSWYDLSINANSLPCETDTAIIVTAWYGHLKWLKAVLTNYRLSGAYVILAYNNPFYPWAPNNDPNAMMRYMPNPGHLTLASSFVMKHMTYDSDKRNGTFWNAHYAQGIIKLFPNIKYVYCTNGDCIWDKPEGLPAVKELLGDGDLMSGQCDDNVIHTAAVLYKVEAFNKIQDYMYEQMRVPVLGSRSPEGMLREAVQELGLKNVKAPKQPIYPQDGTVDMYCCYNQDSTWKELLGFRNLFAEQEAGWEEGREPLPAKYIDDWMDWFYCQGEERETVIQYYITKDRRYLYKWWDCGEDSWYNRWYAPLEAYGKEPIYSKENDADRYK